MTQCESLEWGLALGRSRCSKSYLYTIDNWSIANKKKKVVTWIPNVIQRGSENALYHLSSCWFWLHCTSLGFILLVSNNLNICHRDIFLSLKHLHGTYLDTFVIGLLPSVKRPYANLSSYIRKVIILLSKWIAFVISPRNDAKLVIWYNNVPSPKLP